MAELTQTWLRELFNYDAKTGVLVWRYRDRSTFPTESGWKKFTTRFAGREAGVVDKRSGYRRVNIAGKIYHAHRIVWIYVSGEVPTEVDHINGIRHDNRLQNLRNVERLQNNRNASLQKRNVSGVPGVRWREDAGKWSAYVSVGDRRQYLGLFSTKDEAIAARSKANEKYGFHPNHGREYRR